MIETQRLILRQWKEQDFPLFAKMNGSPTVMKYFENTLSQNKSDELANRIKNLIAERGWGLWALEEKTTGHFMGFVGLNDAPETLLCSPAVEIGWRLSDAFWGKGYASEAALEILDFAFNSLKLEKVVSFTATINTPSIKVMERIGMQNTKQNFQHPGVKGNRLKEHVLYQITAQQWSEMKSKPMR